MNFDLEDKIFNISNCAEFEELAIQVFQIQYKNNPVYRKYCDLRKISSSQIRTIYDIPFLPVSFFKTNKVVSVDTENYTVFESSGTTGQEVSKHFISDISVYEKSFNKAFELFFGKLSEYDILALLPSYSERKTSSLIYMVENLKQKTLNKTDGFFLYNHKDLYTGLLENENRGKKTILIGVSFALLDFFEEYKMKLNFTQILETGGMKGRRKELIREELHQILKESSGLSEICSEYGMTELLSQAYSKGNGIFETTPWMKILIRDTNDPYSYIAKEKTGGVNIIDLANINSCSFIETQDLGKLHSDTQFEILGRFDSGDVRGCNLLVL